MRGHRGLKKFPGPRGERRNVAESGPDAACPMGSDPCPVEQATSKTASAAIAARTGQWPEARRASIRSQIVASRCRPLKRATCCSPVGEVTLISVR